MRVVIVGGGYAGMATLIDIRRRLPDAEIHLVDPRTHHLKLTHLHETVYQSLATYQVAFAELATRFGFIHHPLELTFDEACLANWQMRKAIPIAKGDLQFDYLVIATGARPPTYNDSVNVYTQQHFCSHGSVIIERFLQKVASHSSVSTITIVGGGATGLQFLFTLHELFKRRGITVHLRLIQRNPRLLPDMPLIVDRYVRWRMQQAGIEYLPHTAYIQQQENVLIVRDQNKKVDYSISSELTLCFTGVAPFPCALRTNRYGRVLVNGQPLWNVFAAGDCAHFAAPGLNRLTAQAAVRKGKQVALNIKRIEEKRLPYIYSYNERGYFVSLGAFDGVGWLLVKANVLVGPAALVIKETIELQYDLFVNGLDFYF